MRGGLPSHWGGGGGGLGVGGFGVGGFGGPPPRKFLRNQDCSGTF